MQLLGCIASSLHLVGWQSLISPSSAVTDGDCSAMGHASEPVLVCPDLLAEEGTVTVYGKISDKSR